MDIQKFNQELAKRVRKAQSYERSNDFEHAIQAWLQISELVLKVSKTPKLPFSYKSMLIKKTEQIMAHIKTLDAKIPKKVEEVKMTNEQEIHKEEIRAELQESEGVSKIESDEKSIEDESLTKIPNGFKEIEPAKNFKIVTPHDEEYINKLLSMDPNEHEIGGPSNEPAKEPSSLDLPSEGGKTFCFACGAEVPPNKNTCPQCGTKVE